MYLESSVLFVAATVVCAPAAAQADWSRIPGGPNDPSARQWPGLAYDSLRDRVVLFGGRDSGTAFQDTWEHDGTSWQRVAATHPGHTGVSHEMVFDSKRGRVVIYGGNAKSIADSSTVWEWDGRRWTTFRRAFAPPHWRFVHAMAYDSHRGRTVLFGGGWGNNASLDDTWEWDGSRWFRIRTVTTPPARGGHTMAYDAARRRVVMFGGASRTAALDDTWEYDGTDWKRIPARPAFKMNQSAMVFDAVRQRVVLFGGGLGQDDTWEYDGWRGAWHKRAPRSRPPARFYHRMAYDLRRGRALVFGGRGKDLSYLGDFWSYRTASVATVRSFGRACRGTAGLPGLSVADLRRPWIGDDVELTLGPVARSAPAAFSLGASSTRWAGRALPLDLTPARAPGCWIHTSVDLLGRVSHSGEPRLRLAIPANPWLAGRRVFAQGFSFDRGANALGAVTSNALELRFGIR